MTVYGSGADRPGQRGRGRCARRGRHGAVAGDRREHDAVGVVEPRGAVPAVEDVGRGHRVTVGELDVVAQVEGVGQAVRRDVRHAGGDVGISLRVSSKRYRPPKTFCSKAMSTADDACPGSSVLMSSTIGKRSCWLAASAWVARCPGAAATARGGDERRQHDRESHSAAFHVHLPPTIGMMRTHVRVRCACRATLRTDGSR